jgi:hypothetical protein
LAAAALALMGPCQVALAGPFAHRSNLAAINEQLAGKVIDFTHNHGKDRRIWSYALNEPRDLYVYVPPGFDPCQQYPLVLWLHSFMWDEQSFLHGIVQMVDGAIACGKLPPMIVAAPDGSISGKPSYFNAGSFFVNSKAGNFEDYVMQDVWSFLLCNFPIRPEREAHVISGGSMGGFSAYNLGMKYPERFKIILGILPPLNLRWVDCHCRYMSPFDPCCWGWRTEVDRGHEVIGRFYGVVTIRLKKVIDPLFGRGPEAIAAVSRENPIEMLERLNVPNGLFDMYIGYAGRDELNIDAQVESFLYVARQRGLCVSVGYVPNGRHNLKTAEKLFPGVADWLAPRLAPYSPPSPACFQSFFETP